MAENNKIEPLLPDEIKELAFVKSEDGSYKGWKRELLVEKIAKTEEKLLLCKVCNGLLREASLFENEGKQELRCSLCLPENIPTQRQCIIQESINEKNVECPLKSKGCKWSQMLTQVISHLNECPLLPLKCPLGCVTDRGEGKGEVSRLERRFLEEHQRMNCPMRLISCESCNRLIKACKMNEHIQTCGEYLVPCPNLCVGEEGPTQTKRKDIATHLEACPLQKVECPYAEYGCGEKMERRTIDQHERESTHKHFRITMLHMRTVNREQAGEIARLKLAIVEKENQITNLTSRHTSEMAAMKDEINSVVSAIINPRSGSVDWEVTGVTDRIKNKDVTFSDPFHVCLYKFQSEIHWDFGSGGNVSVFVRIIKGSWDDKLKWPARYNMKIILFDQHDTLLNHISYHEMTQIDMEKFAQCFQKPKGLNNRGFGASKFMSQKEIQQERYLKNDSLSLKIVVELLSVSNNVI